MCEYLKEKRRKKKGERERKKERGRERKKERGREKAIHDHVHNNITQTHANVCCHHGNTYPRPNVRQ